MASSQESQAGSREPIKDVQVVCGKKTGCSAIPCRRASLSSIRELTQEVNCDRVPSWGIDNILSTFKGPRTPTVPQFLVDTHPGALQYLPSIQKKNNDSHQTVSKSCQPVYTSPVPFKDMPCPKDGEKCPPSPEECTSTFSPYTANIHSHSSLDYFVHDQTMVKRSPSSLKRPYPSEDKDKFPSVISIDRKEDPNGRIVLKLKVPSLYYSNQTNNSGELLQRLHRKKKRRKHRKHRFDEDISEHGMSLRKPKPSLTYTDTQVVTDDDRKLKWSLRSTISQVSRFSDEYIDVSLYKRNFREKQTSRRTRHSGALVGDTFDKAIESFDVVPIYVYTKLNHSIIEHVVCDAYSAHTDNKLTVKVEAAPVELPPKQSSKHSKKRKKKRKRKKLKQHIETVLSEKASESLLVTDTLVNTQYSVPKKQPCPASPEMPEEAEQQPQENFPLLLASLRAPAENVTNLGSETDITQEIAKEVIIGKQTCINEVTIEKISPSNLPETITGANLSVASIQEPLDLKRRIENKVTIEKVSDRHQGFVVSNDKVSQVLITPIQSKPDDNEEANAQKPKKETLLSVLLQQNNKSTPSVTFQPVTSTQSHLPYRERTPPLHDRLSHMPCTASERGINRYFQQKKTPPTVRVAPVMKPREQPTSSQPSTCHLLKQYLSTGPSKKESECEVVYSSGQEELVSRLNSAPASTNAMRNSLMMFPHPAETNAAFMRYFTEINRYHMEWLEWVRKSQSSHSYSEPVIYNPFRYPIGEPEVPTLQPEVPVTNWKIRIPPKEKPPSPETSDRAVPPLIPIKKSTS